MPDQYYQVLTTTDSRDAAVELGRKAVEGRFAACSQVSGPITSVYWWEGAVQQAEEWQCIMKTTSGRLVDLRDYIKSVHSYDVPEIVATPISAGNPDYLAWIAAETEQRRSA